MNLSDLTPAIERISSSPVVDELRAVTYLQTYPSIRAIVQGRVKIDLCLFHQLATAIYGWMPRVIRIDSPYLKSVLVAINDALNIERESFSKVDIMSLANCLHSLVGASKVLHFINPTVFPIWDRRIEELRIGKKPSQSHMGNIESLFSYIHDVHKIVMDDNFQYYFRDFQSAFKLRLIACNILPYEVSKIRAIEYSALVLTDT